MAYTYVCMDDNGASNLEDVSVLLSVGSRFRCEYGTCIVTDGLGTYWGTPDAVLADRVGRETSPIFTILKGK